MRSDGFGVGFFFFIYELLRTPVPFPEWASHPGAGSPAQTPYRGWTFPPPPPSLAGNVLCGPSTPGIWETKLQPVPPAYLPRLPLLLL